jgi:hypothetical protein
MSITLNGTSQYVSLGDAVNVYQTRPWSCFALINSASLRTAGGYNGIFAQGQYSASAPRGWGFEIVANADGDLYAFKSAGAASQAEVNAAASQVTPNTGWWLAGCVMRDSGAATVCDFFAYRYNTNTLTVDIGLGLGADAEGVVPAAGDTACIGVIDDGTSGVIDWYPGAIGWVMVSALDLGNAGDNQARPVWEMIARGPWGLLDSNCRLFVPFSDAARDLSGYGLHGTLIASPSYVGSGPTELPPWVSIGLGVGVAGAPPPDTGTMGVMPQLYGRLRPAIFAPGVAR